MSVSRDFHTVAENLHDTGMSGLSRPHALIALSKNPLGFRRRGFRGFAHSSGVKHGVVREVYAAHVVAEDTDRSHDGNAQVH